jgi:hypothetical protein
MKSLIRWLKSLHTSKHLNSGQAIVLIGAASIGLIAMMGLAIDGGRLLFLQRDTRNAADAAAVAAARALCTGRDPEPFALAAAHENGYDNNQIDNWVSVHSPPLNAGYAITEECAGCYVEVEITSEIPPTFIGIVYDGDLVATSHAIGTCNPDITANQPPALRAVFALGDDSQCPPNAVNFQGSSNTIDGGMHSNDTMKIQSSSDGGTVIGPASVVTKFKPGEIVGGENKVNWVTGSDDSDTSETSTGTCLGACFEGASDDSSSYPSQNPFVIDEPYSEYPLDHDIADFQPGGSEATIAAAASEYYEWDCSGPAGKFSDWLIGSHLSGGALDNGIYYADCDIKIKGNELDDVTGNVTIVATGSIDVHGDGQQWVPYTQDLLLMSSDGTCGGGGAIQFSGPDNSWEGNIFAPNGGINFSGSANHNEVHGCVVGLGVSFSGSDNQVICPVDTEHEPQPGIWLSE